MIESRQSPDPAERGAAAPARAIRYRAEAEPPIHARGTLSRLVAWTVGVFIVALGGVFLLVLLSLGTGFTPSPSLIRTPQFFRLAVFVLAQIALITFCGYFVVRWARRAMSPSPIAPMADLEIASAESLPYRANAQRSIRARLTLSHLVAVTASTFIYATGGFLLAVLLYFWSGNTLAELPLLIPEFFVLTIFVLIQIALITFCGLFVARLASRAVSRSLIAQIAELESATEEFANGRLERRVRVITDDELGHLANRFNFLAERLDELDHQRRSFVANVSHDLRTPITIIRAHLDAQSSQATEQPDDTITPEESFAVIERETETLAKLVDDLFMLSRLEEAALPFRQEPVDVHHLAEKIVDAIRPYALKTSRVSVNSLVPDDLPPALGDPTRMTQIVNNLLHNAIRHTPAGGVVVLDSRAVMANQWIEIVVRDTGVGIPADQLPFIFERFYHGESVRETGGTGLGLSIVKQLVEMQGGSVAAQSTLGEGTAITFRLPAGRRVSAPRPVSTERSRTAALS